MPTEIYNCSLRTKRIRNLAVVNGLNKVARALDNTTQLSFIMGKIISKTKNSSGITVDYGCCRVQGAVTGGLPSSIPKFYINGGNPSSSMHTNIINGGIV